MFKRNELVIGVKGASLGLILATVIAFAQGHFLGKSPVTLSPLQLDASLPILFSGLSAMEGYFIKLITLIVPFVIAERTSQGWQKGKIWTLLVLLLSGFALVGKLPLTWWLIAGFTCGIVMILLYVFVLRFNMIYIPVMAGVMILLDLLQYIIVDPASLSWMYVIVSAIVTIALTLLAVYGMYMARILQPKTIDN